MKKTLLLTAICALLAGAWTGAQAQDGKTVNVEELLLKDYRPVSVFNVPQNYVEKAKYPVIDLHSHNYARDREEVRRWVETMDAAGVEVTHVLSNSRGTSLEETIGKYSEFPDRFKVWCSLDYTGFDRPDWEERAVATLVRHHEMGAVGIGEMGDKGLGDLYAVPTKGAGIHFDNPRMKVIYEKCAELGMPLSIHMADPIWMYLPIDERNDGLMNARKWMVDTTVEGCLDYDEVILSFINAVEQNPNTTFIACHYLNMSHDLPRLAAIMDKYPNLYLDISARVSESGATPRATREFIIKYADRLVFGTDNGMGANMYRTVYRQLETADEHIITNGNSYYWPVSGFYLPDDVLRKIYRDNALKILGKEEPAGKTPKPKRKK